MDNNETSIRELEIFLRSGTARYYGGTIYPLVNPNNKLFVKYSPPRSLGALLLFTYDGEYVRYLRDNTVEFMDVITEFATHVGATLKDYQRLRIDDDATWTNYFDLKDKRREVDDTELMNTCSIQPLERKYHLDEHMLWGERMLDPYMQSLMGSPFGFGTMEPVQDE